MSQEFEPTGGKKPLRPHMIEAGGSRKRGMEAMFTGIVEEMGVVKGLEKSLAGARLTILAQTIMPDLAQGASVSVNGACLTVVGRGDREFAVDLSPRDHLGYHPGKADGRHAGQSGTGDEDQRAASAAISGGG